MRRRRIETRASPFVLSLSKHELDRVSPFDRLRANG